MPPVILTLLQALFLLLLYVFVFRAVRTIARDLAPAVPSTPPRAKAPRPRPVERLRKERRRAPRELVVHLPDSAPRVITLEAVADSAGVMFGRTPEAMVQLDDPYASDRHAKIYQVDGEWLLADLGSTNGTYRNKEKVTAPARLASGDQIAIGKTVIEVRH